MSRSPFLRAGAPAGTASFSAEVACVFQWPERPSATDFQGASRSGSVPGSITGWMRALEWSYLRLCPFGNAALVTLKTQSRNGRAQSPIPILVDITEDWSVGRDCL
jgi:hypothetical protein